MKKLFILFVIAFTVNASAQESVLLRFNYKKGDVYKTEISQNISSPQMVLDMKITTKQSIVNVAGDIYNTESKITKVVVDLMQGSNNMSYDSSVADDELDQMGLMLKSQMGPMLKSVVSIKSTNLGKVLESSATVQFQGSENFGQSNVVFPKKPVRVGDTFKMDQTAQGLTLTLIYTVKSISANSVVLALSTSNDGTEIKGTMTIDKDSGVVLNSKIETTVEAQGVKTIVKNVTTKMQFTYFLENKKSLKNFLRFFLPLIKHSCQASFY